MPIHFIRVRGKGPNPKPLILSHGWPWTFWDVRKIIGPLTDPAAHGLDPADSFDVVLISLPGYGFSSPLRETGWNWWRTADLENTRKRTKREIDDAKIDAKFKVLKEMLPVVDNLERAIEHAGGPGEKNAIVEGVQLVLRQFTTAFERLEVTAIDAMGQPFDPNLHEAISQQESDQPPGTVVQVLQRGYRAGDRLLRPALVVVAKAKPAPEGQA